VIADSNDLKYFTATQGTGGILGLITTWFSTRNTLITGLTLYPNCPPTASGWANIATLQVITQNISNQIESIIAKLDAQANYVPAEELPAEVLENDDGRFTYRSTLFLKKNNIASIPVLSTTLKSQLETLGTYMSAVRTAVLNRMQALSSYCALNFNKKFLKQQKFWLTEIVEKQVGSLRQELGLKRVIDSGNAELENAESILLELEAPKSVWIPRPSFLDLRVMMNSVYFTWSGMDHVKKYVVYRRPYSEDFDDSEWGEEFAVGTIEDIDEETDAVRSQFVDSGLPVGAYVYRVRAVDGDTASLMSSVFNDKGERIYVEVQT